MSYSYTGQPVIASELCFQRDGDSFFSPATLGHTGFAYDGNYYSAGVPTAGQVASWASEAPSATRGPSVNFPEDALVIVSRVSVAILDASSDPLIPWMLFYFADSNAYADNSQGQDAGYVAAAATWANGRLSVTMTPDAGSTPQAVVVLTFDFVADTVYADTSV